ncbi:hypothetical protein Tco_0060897, partial [Tanacetum coccineum]
MDGKGKSAEKKEKTMIPPRRGQVKERIFEELGEKILNMTLGGGNHGAMDGLILDRDNTLKYLES